MTSSQLLRLWRGNSLLNVTIAPSAEWWRKWVLAGYLFIHNVLFSFSTIVPCFTFLWQQDLLIFINVRKTKKLMNKQQPSALDAESSRTLRVVPEKFAFFLPIVTVEKWHKKTRGSSSLRVQILNYSRVTIDELGQSQTGDQGVNVIILLAVLSVWKAWWASDGHFTDGWTGHSTLRPSDTSATLSQLWCERDKVQTDLTLSILSQ